MASSVSQHSIFQCCICLDNFTDPVSIPCGHNFCKACIYSYWDTADIIQCPLCQQTFQKRLQLKVNVLLRDLIEQKQTKVQDVSKTENRTQGILCDVCVGERKATAVKSCLLCEASYCPDHVKPHQDDVQLKTHELLDPVSTLKERVCKHHKSPLELVCLQDLTCVCVMCIKADHQNHQCVPLQRRLGKKKAQIDRELEELQQEIKDRRKMLMQVEQSGELSEDNIRTDIADVQQIFAHLQTLLKINEAGLLTVLTLQHGKAKNHCESIKEKLQEEITELEIRQGELDHLSQITDDLHLLQSAHSLSEPPVTKDWSEASAYSDSAVGTVRSGVIRLRNELHNKVTDEVKGLVTKEIKRIQQYAVDVTLDSDTANSLLVVSNDGKQVTNEGVLQNLPDNPERFDVLLGVLGKEGFSSGAFYFEVQVEGKAAWDIGIAVETVDRKGNVAVSLRNGYAALMFRDGKTLKACDQRPMEFVVSLSLKKIGVFVDHEAGEVCFYDVENNGHIYSFTRCQFPKKKLHPYLNTCSHHEANNSPMVITPIG